MIYAKMVSKLGDLTVRMIPIPVQIGFRIKNRNPDPGPKVTDPGPKVPDPGPKVPDPNLL